MLNYYKPTLVILVKTHLTDHNMLRDDFGFNELVESPVEGNSGGMVIIWNNALITVEQVAVTNQTIHCMVQVNSTLTPFMLSTIYAKNSQLHRRELWQYLRTIADQYKGPWMVGGDFNDIVNAHEKFGGKQIHVNRSNNFLKCLNYCSLVDLGYCGSKFTWTNKRKIGDLILERIDRVIANYEWLTLFSEAHILHLPRTHSDHCPLLLSLNSFRPPPNKVFRFESI